MKYICYLVSIALDKNLKEKKCKSQQLSVIIINKYSHVIYESTTQLFSSFFSLEQTSASEPLTID